MKIMNFLDKLNNLNNKLEQIVASQEEKKKDIVPADETPVELAPIDAAIVQANTPKGLSNQILSIPFSDITMLGTTFAQMIPSLRTISQTVTMGRDAYIPINNMNGEALKLFRQNTTGVYAGAFFDANTGKSTMAELVKQQPETITTNAVLPVNPAMLMMSAMLVTIEHKLDDIQETQKAILSFLEQDKQAEQQADLRFLSDTLNGYKYNWDNEQYLQSHHIKALDIKQTADKNVGFYQKQISAEILKTSAARFDQMVKSSIINLEKLFNEYRMAIYLFGFASFMEMLLLGNYQADYLNQVSMRVQTYDLQFKSHFVQCRDIVRKYSGESLETKVLSGLGNATKYLGKFVSNSAALSRRSVDEWLQNSGEKLLKGNDAKVEKTAALFTGSEETGSSLFVESIQNVSFINNQASGIHFDGESIIFLTESA